MKLPKDKKMLVIGLAGAGILALIVLMKSKKSSTEETATSGTVPASPTSPEATALAQENAAGVAQLRNEIPGAIQSALQSTLQNNALEGSEQQLRSLAEEQRNLKGELNRAAEREKKSDSETHHLLGEVNHLSGVVTHLKAGQQVGGGRHATAKAHAAVHPHPAKRRR